MPGCPSAPGRPKTVLAKLLHYKDRDSILQQSRTKGPYTLDNNKVLMFPYFTAVVQAQRVSFIDVKKALQEAGLKFSVIFPAKLRIILDDSTHFCQSPKDTWTWLVAYGKGAPMPKPQRCPRRPKSTEGLKRKRPKKLSKLKKPTISQTQQDRKAALQAVTLLMASQSSEKHIGSSSEQPVQSSDSEVNTGTDTQLTQITPRSADDII